MSEEKLPVVPLYADEGEREKEIVVDGCAPFTIRYRVPTSDVIAALGADEARGAQGMPSDPMADGVTLCAFLRSHITSWTLPYPKADETFRRLPPQALLLIRNEIINAALDRGN